VHVKALFSQLASERQPTGKQRTANWRYCGQLAVCVWQLSESWGWNAQILFTLHPFVV